MNKILEGLKETITSLRCEHEWHVTDVEIKRSVLRVVRICSVCKMRETKFQSLND